MVSLVICPRARDRAATDALPAAMLSLDVGRVRTLIADGADPNLADERGETPAFFAVRAGHLQLLKELRSAGANLTARSETGYTPLLLAAALAPIEMVRLLLRTGADPNDQDNEDRVTALHLAALRNRVQVVVLLIEAGSRIEACATGRRTPLMMAAESGSVDAACALLPGCPLEDRSEALLVASRTGCVTMVKLLLTAGADPRYPSARGTTALAFAWETKGSTDILKLFARWGRPADP